MWLFNSHLSLEDVLTRVISIAIIIFLILPLHEYAHAKIAYRLGDPTAKNAGRITINPIKSLDPIGAVAMFIFGFGWAKSVPVNPRYFKNPKRDLALVALAGPLVNLIAGFVCCLLENVVRFAYYNGPLGYDTAVALVSFFYFCAIINIGLAIFNLIPIPPLDGSKILAAFLPDKVVAAYYRSQRYLMIVVFLLIYMRVLSLPIDAAREGIYSVFSYITALPFGL